MAIPASAPEESWLPGCAFAEEDEAEEDEVIDADVVVMPALLVLTIAVAVVEVLDGASFVIVEAPFDISVKAVASPANVKTVADEFEQQFKGSAALTS